MKKFQLIMFRSEDGLFSLGTEFADKEWLVPLGKRQDAIDPATIARAISDLKSVINYYCEHPKEI